MMLERISLILMLIASLSQTGCSSNVTTLGGVDLRHWQNIGDAQWNIQSNSAQATAATSQGYLVSPTQLSNFQLTVEFWIEDDTNSGVFIRCNNPVQIDPDNCYEINLWDNHPNQAARTGSIVKRSPPLSQVETLGRWNTLMISARDNVITVSINDALTADYQDHSLTKGYVALQYFGHQKLKFRALKITQL